MFIATCNNVGFKKIHSNVNINVNTYIYRYKKIEI